MSGQDLKRTWRVGSLRVEADVRLEEDRLVGVLRRDGGEERVEARTHRTAPDAVIVRYGGRLHRAVLARQGTTLWVAVEGRTYEFQIDVGGRGGAHAGAERLATSPMTGTVLVVSVEAGEVVEEGQILFVVEAMKMEYAVRAPRAATIAEVRAAPGEKVKVGDPVVTFAEDAS